MKSPVYDFLSPRLMTLGPEGEDAGYSHWRLARDEQGIAWAILDREGESANAISGEVLEELDRILAGLEDNPPRGLVLRSANPGGFAAGADIREFRGATDAQIVRERLTRAHAVVDRLAAAAFPSVALIHGYCLGAGLELALACRYRIAVGDARLGLPEVMLGLHPGLGGTVRLPRLINPLQAMTLMLTGKTVHARKAERLGLVDEAVPPRHAEAAARAAVAGGLERQNPGLQARLLSSAPGRRLAARRMRAKTAAKADPSSYPAPHALIHIWEEHGDDEAAMREAEITSFAQLMTGQTAQNLIRVFFLRERLKSGARGEHGIERVHVIGAGAMGGDIAAWCALRGFEVTLADLDPAALAGAVGRAAGLYRDRLHDEAKRREALDRLVPDFAGDGLARADLVIEAIAETAEAKAGLFAAIEPRMKPDALLATNTSSIPLETLRDGLERPDRFLGLHFFNPVSRMQLVEVVAHDGAEKSGLQRAAAFCGALDRLPVTVASAPGFLVNRVLTPYLMEALVLIDEGIAPATIDRAAERFGMAMGPVEVADRVGLDVCLHVAERLSERLEQPLPEPPEWLRTRAEAGFLGRKSGRGIYEWHKDKPQKGAAAEPDPELTDRLILPMVNASAACLREGVVADTDLLDAAMIFGAGFAPFRGGPANYARRRDVGEIREVLERLAEKHGPRFAPDDGLELLQQP